MNDAELRELFAKRIRCRIVALRIDQRELARRSGLTEASLSRYIKHHRKPTYDIVIRLAQALECSPGDLINIDEPYEY
jgi:transcriptional regulator with XRE-family HTH domain